jgi:hypothetical protein
MNIISNLLHIYMLTAAPRPALGPTKPATQWVPWPLSAGVKRGRNVMLTTHPILVPKSRRSRNYTSGHQITPLRSVTELYLFLLYIYTCCWQYNELLRDRVYRRYECPYDMHYIYYIMLCNTILYNIVI